MNAEHGISFNKPYSRQMSLDNSPDSLLKDRVRISGTGSNYTIDTPEILIPLTVIGDDVFSVAMVLRTSTSLTEYEVQAPSYPGGMPLTNSFYWQERERLAYFVVTPLKEFIEQWKLKD